MAHRSRCPVCGCTLAARRREEGEVVYKCGTGRDLAGRFVYVTPTCVQTRAARQAKGWQTGWLEPTRGAGIYWDGEDYAR